MKLGFTLIEFMVAMMISALLAGFLFQSFSSLNTSMRVAESFMDFDMRIAIFTNQLEKDLMGAFVAQPVEKKQQGKKDEKNTKQQEQNKQEFLKDTFYGENKNNILDIVTFISNNPVGVYEFAKNVKPKPRVVRIAYRMVQDKKKKNVYSVVRQESENLDFAAFDLKKGSKVRPFTLIENVKSMKISFLYPIFEEDKKTNEKKIKEFKQNASWRFPNNKQEGASSMPHLPSAVRLKMTLWDNKQEEERSYDMQFSLISNGFEQEDKENKKVDNEQQQPSGKRKSVRNVINEKMKLLLQ